MTVMMETLREWTCIFAAEVSAVVQMPIGVLVKQMPAMRELSTFSVFFRLVLAMVFGGAIGLERGRKNRPAGFRTYMVVCLGATLTMILGQYELHLMETVWQSQAELAGAKTDITRFGAQVINGVGFLGAGSILITGRQQIKGLTTAAGLWASACMGLVIGASFYECAFLGFFMIMTAMRLLPRVEAYLIENARNMNVYVELYALEGINEVIARLKSMDIHIYEVDIERAKKANNSRPNAVLSVGLPKSQSHTKVMAALAELESISVIKEI